MKKLYKNNNPYILNISIKENKYIIKWSDENLECAFNLNHILKKV